MTNFEIIKRLYKTYTKNYINKILISVFFSLLVAGSTSAIAWLLDPAIEKIFIEKDQTLILIIPAFIILAFATKGLSMYLAKVIMIGVAQDVQKNVQTDMLNTLIGLLTVMFYQNWKLSLVALVMIPLASFFARSLGKRMGKVSTELQEKVGNLTTYLFEIFKNHKLIKIFQRENYENTRSDKFLNELKEKNIKTNIVLVRAHQ